MSVYWFLGNIYDEAGGDKLAKRKKDKFKEIKKL